MSAFVRRYSARIAAWICTLRGHEWGRWATKQTASGPLVAAGVLVAGERVAAHGERKCKRCGVIEFGAAPKKRTRRAPTDADTVQPKAPHG